MLHPAPRFSRVLMIGSQCRYLLQLAHFALLMMAFHGTLATLDGMPLDRLAKVPDTHQDSACPPESWLHRITQ